MRGLTYSNHITSDVLENKTKKRENPSPWQISHEKLRPKYFHTGVMVNLWDQKLWIHSKTATLWKVNGAPQTDLNILKNHYFHIVYQRKDVKFCLCHDQGNPSGYCWTGSETSVLNFYSWTLIQLPIILWFLCREALNRWTTDKWKGSVG